MPITHFSLFFSVTFLVSAGPGPIMLSCMANGARLGLQKAFTGMLGASAGNLCLVALSALGAGLVISQNDVWFNLLKWLGAGYLVFLGWQLMHAPLIQDDSQLSANIPSNQSIWLNSFFIAVGNPKGLLYFGALFPQFINYQEPLTLQLLILTITFLFTDLIWMLIYAASGNKIMQWLKSPKHQKQFNTISALLLIAAGIFMALSGHVHE